MPDWNFNIAFIPALIFLAVFVGTIIVGFLYAPYWMYQEKHDEARHLQIEINDMKTPKLRLRFGHGGAFSSSPALEDGSGQLTTKRIEVRNLSHLLLNNVRVQLAAIWRNGEPWAAPDLPASLTRLHDETVPLAQSFSLNGQDVEYLELIRKPEGETHRDSPMTICYANHSIRNNLLPDAQWIFLVHAHADKSSAAAEEYFLLDFDSIGNMRLRQAEVTFTPPPTLQTPSSQRSGASSSCP